jgi:RNA polymerase sigma-70 factor (ECF subfamily)
MSLRHREAGDKEIWSPGSLDPGLPDDELVRRCRLRRAGEPAGNENEAAVRALTLRYNQRLFRIARGILRNDGEAEDVVQDAYVRAFTSLDQFRGDASFGTWLTRIAMNEALGRLRRRRATVDWPAGGDEPIRAQILHFPAASSGADPEAAMATEQLREFIERAIDELPDTFRTVFVARMVEGLSIEETAELFGLRPETVKTRVHRARARLRASLESTLGSTVNEAFAFDGARCQRLTDAVVRRLGLSA